MRTLALIVLILVTAAPAVAEMVTEYSVEYSLRGDISQATQFYGMGTYEFLLTPNYVTVYLQNQGWQFLGLYGQITLPASMPQISFPTGTDVANAVPHFVEVTPSVSVPELAILPRLLPRGFGLGLEAKVTRALQHATAWGAAHLLGVPRDGVTLVLRRVRVEVAEACSGLQTLIVMLAAAALIAAVLPARRLPWELVLVVAAIILALEANALRVAGISIGLEYLGSLSPAAKDWIGVGTTGLALVQMAVLGRLVGLGRLLAR